MKRVLILLVLMGVLCTGTANAALTGPRWWQIQDKPTTISGYGITDAASITALTDSIATHAAMASGTHGIPEGGEFASASGTQNLTNKTLDSSNSIAGEAIDSGTVAADRIDALIARVADVLAYREDITIAGDATTTLTLTTMTCNALNKTIISINGSIQPLACFTKTDSTHIEVDTQLPVGTVVSVFRFD